MVKSTFLRSGGHGQGNGCGGIERVGVVGTEGKGRWRGCLGGYGSGRGALVFKDEDAAVAAFGTHSEHD